MPLEKYHSRTLKPKNKFNVKITMNEQPAQYTFD